tara:strand:+ start:121 stop:474 length:354 start_codon:yes stop_codon:yes gene_type:complete
MINNKMLKEPLFLEFNSSGALNRAEQADTKINKKDSLEDYKLLSKEATLCSSLSGKYDNERESMNTNSASLNEKDNRIQSSTNIADDSFYCCLSYDVLRTMVPDCIRELRLGFCFNE